MESMSEYEHNLELNQTNPILFVIHTVLRISVLLLPLNCKQYNHQQNNKHIQSIHYFFVYTKVTKEPRITSNLTVSTCSITSATLFLKVTNDTTIFLKLPV